MKTMRYLFLPVYFLMACVASAQQPHQVTSDAGMPLATVALTVWLLLALAVAYIIHMRNELVKTEALRKAAHESGKMWMRKYDDAVLFRGTPKPDGEGFLDVAQLRLALDAEQKGSASLADELKEAYDKLGAANTELALVKRSNAALRGHRKAPAKAKK